MAVGQNTTNKTGIIYEEYIWGNYFKGKKEELIKTGKFKQEWFPGEGTNKKTSMKYEGEILKKLTGITFNIKELHILRKDSTRKIFTVYLTVPDEEQQTRKEKYSLECLQTKKKRLKKNLLN